MITCLIRQNINLKIRGDNMNDYTLKLYKADKYQSYTYVPNVFSDMCQMYVHNVDTPVNMSN